jgi:chromosome segregation ATPase
MIELPGSSARRRFTLKSLENLLLAFAVIAGAAVGIHALTSGSSPDAPGADAVSPRLSATRSGQADASAPVSESPASAGKQGDELRAQLSQATEQLKASQGRISQLEGQLKQAPSAADLDKADKQGEELRAQLAQATNQLKASQGRMKQAPSAADKAGKQGDELRAQLTQATEQLKTSQGRISQLEGQLKQAPRGADLDKAGKQGDERRAQLTQATAQL